MRRRIKWSGLQVRMALSYVGVTVACVLLLEILGIVIFAMLFLNTNWLAARVEQTTQHYSQVAAQRAGGGALAPDPAFTLGDPNSPATPGQISFGNNGVDIPYIAKLYPAEQSIALALLIGRDDRILASSYPARYPVGSNIAQVLSRTTQSVAAALAGQPARANMANLPEGRVMRAVAPVWGKAAMPIGALYVHVPGPPASWLGWLPTDLKSWFDIGMPLLASGIVLLIVTAPIGTLFGMITTRGLVRRLQRLGNATEVFARSDFSQRVPDTSSDEIGQLERHFNHMAEEIETSIAKQHQLTEQNARLAERSRISRELHDSISQDLFSLTMLAGGLQDALPPDSSFQAQVDQLEKTAARMQREMRALLLELRPAPLEHLGLARSLEEIAVAYGSRLGIDINLEIEPVVLDASAEHALFRVAQEAISNAVRHANATTITLHLATVGEQVVQTIRDDGSGFVYDADTTQHGLGLRLMRERIYEFGGTVTLDTAPGQGTQLQVTLPRGCRGNTHFDCR